MHRYFYYEGSSFSALSSPSGLKQVLMSSRGSAARTPACNLTVLSGLYNGDAETRRRKDARVARLYGTY